MKTSLGLLEVSGLALAIGAADAMAKAASVTLIGMEKTNGSGWMLIRLTGDVASVQAAIATGAAFAEQRNGLVARAVLARPADSLMEYWQEPQPAAVQEAPAAACAEALIAVIEETPTPADPQVKTEAEIAPLTEEPEPPVVQASCNLCQDPACSRQKGEPRERCLHTGKRGNA